MTSIYYRKSCLIIMIKQYWGIVRGHTNCAYAATQNKQGEVGSQYNTESRLLKNIVCERKVYRVKSGKFGHQVNSDPHLQTV